MLLYFLALAVILSGSSCRWKASTSRVLPPAHFGPTALGWWFPPLPALGEFGTAEAWRLEVLGRRLLRVGVLLMLLATVGTLTG